MKLKTEKFIATIMFTALSFAFFGGATDFIHADYIPLAPLPGTTNSGGAVNLNTYVPGIFNLAIGIAGVLAVLMIIIGGVEYMTTDAIQGKSDGKARITNALTGLLLVLVSWILLYTINPRLTIFDLNVGETTSVNSGNGGNSFDYTSLMKEKKSNVGDINRKVTDVDDLQFDFNSNVGDINRDVKNVKDLQFDFGHQ